MTFVDFTEFIWRQQSTQCSANILGWGVDKVKRYSAMNGISEKAWAIIVPTFDKNEKCPEDVEGTEKVPVGTFSERLLRNILDLTDWQQLELVTDLAAETITKNKFIKSAKAYGQQNLDIDALCAEAKALVSEHKITADILGWSVPKVKQYSALNIIDEKAWAVIVTTFDNAEKLHSQSGVTEKVTDVTFTEGLLRNILDLTDWQQLELITDLAAGTITKNKFIKSAQAYGQQNLDIDALCAEVKGRLFQRLGNFCIIAL